jgi:hypothetical protein
MAIHRRTLEDYITTGHTANFEAYLRCLLDTFGREYVEHLLRWLEADGFAVAPPDRTADSGAATPMSVPLTVARVDRRDV